MRRGATSRRRKRGGCPRTHTEAHHLRPEHRARARTLPRGRWADARAPLFLSQKKASPLLGGGRSGGFVDMITSPFVGVRDAVYDNVIKPYAEPSREKLLPDHPPQLRDKATKPTLVISLDGTLIESTWSRQYGWRYAKRPGVDEFLYMLAPLYELVLWTDAMNTADPVVDKLDKHRLFRHRLYRDTTTFADGAHKKDLRALNRDLERVLIVDCDASSTSMHPEHALLVKKYCADDDPEKKDTELKKLVPFLQYLALARVPSLRDEYAKLDDRADVGGSFERRIAELRASGQLPLARARGFGSLGGRGAGNAAGAGSKGSIWEYLRR